MQPSIRDMKAYVPAKDYEVSKRFYAALGFTQTAGFGGTTDCSLGGFTLRLQPYYVPAWADNFMIVMTVDDVAAWEERATEVLRDATFAPARMKMIEEVGDSRVLHVIDPAGVLLIFVQ